MKPVSRHPASVQSGRPPLAEFRSGRSDCILAVWGDIEAGLVLAADGDLFHPQEYLDALCAEAAQVFSTLPPNPDDTLDQVVVFDPTGGRLFVRAPSNPSNSLSCLCPPDADLGALLQAMADFVIDHTVSEFGQ